MPINIFPPYFFPVTYFPSVYAGSLCREHWNTRIVVKRIFLSQAPSAANYQARGPSRQGRARNDGLDLGWMAQRPLLVDGAGGCGVLLVLGVQATVPKSG